MERLRRGIAGLAFACRLLSSIIIVLMMLTICYDVFRRYVFSDPTTWVLELNAISVLALAFLALPDLYTRDEHIAMDLLHDRMNTTLRRHAAIIITIAVALFGVVIATLGTSTTVQTFQAGLLTPGMTPIPVWCVYALIPFGTALLVLLVVLNPRPTESHRRAEPEEVGR